MALFPASPTNGQTANVNGISYVYNSSQTAWIRSSSASSTDLAVTGNISASGNVTASFFIGNGSQLTGITAATAGTVTTAAQPNITSTGALTSPSFTANSGTGRVLLATDAGGSISLGRVDGTASSPYIDFNTSATAVDYDVRIQASGNTGTVGGGTLTIAAATTNVSAAMNVAGNLAAGNLSATLLGGTLTTAAQPNITSTGTLTSLTVSGNVNFDSNTLFVDSVNNNVGIGTTSPTSRLTITGGVTEIRDGNYLMLRPSGNAWDMRLQATGTQLDILSGGALGSPIMSLVNGGNVGIGNTNPGSKLTVAGTIESTTGGVKFPDGTTQTSAGINTGKSIAMAMIFGG